MTSVCVRALIMFSLQNADKSIIWIKATELIVQIQLHLCDGTESLLSYIWLKPAFDIAMETVDHSIENGLYKNVNFKLTFYQNCMYDAIGQTATQYYQRSFDVLFGPH